MCFWFDLEILRLVYKKAFFEILNGFYLFDLLSSEKSSPLQELKKVSSKLGIQGIKRSGILRWFKKCVEVSGLAKGEKNLYKKLNFEGLGKFSKKSFFWEKFFYTFLKNSASFDTLCVHFWRNFFPGAIFFLKLQAQIR